MYVDRSESASQIFQKAGLTMDLNRTVPRLCALTTAALTLIAVILRTVAMLTSFDAEIGYFDPSVSVTLNHALYFVTAVLLIAAACFIPRGALPRELNALPARTPLSVLVGLVLAAFTVAAFILCAPAAQELTPDPKGRLILAPILLGLPAAVYFLLSANRNGRYSDALGLAGFLPALWCVSGIAELYFDQFVTMNSPVKVSLHLGLLGFLFITLFELRFRIGRSLPRVAVVLFGMGSFTCLNASIPLLIATGAKVLDHRMHMLYAAVLLAAGLYGLCLLFGCCYAAPAEAVTPEAAPSPTEAPDNDV